MASGVDNEGGAPPPDSQPSQPSGYWTFNPGAWQEAAVRGRARQSQPAYQPPAAAASLHPWWAERTERPWHPEDLVTFYVCEWQGRSLWKLYSIRWGVILTGRDRWGREAELAFPSWPAARNFVEWTTDLIVDEYSVEVLARTDTDGARALLYAELVERLGPECITYRVRSREFHTWTGTTVRRQP